MCRPEHGPCRRCGPSARHSAEAGLITQIQQPAARYRIIDREALCALLGTADEKLAALQNQWIEATLARGGAEREPQWSEAVAVGRRSFVERVQEELGTRAWHRHVQDGNGAWVLRDPAAPYRPHSTGQMAALSQILPVDSRES